MDLNFNQQLVENYHSQSQAIRIMTEDWFERNMFCPRCGNFHVAKFKNNLPVADFYCQNCNSEYELKSKNGNLSSKIADGAYDTMIERIIGNNNPDLFCLKYEKNNNSVTDLIFIPKYFFTPRVIEKRKPLKETARRAGWVGCNILIGQIPEQAKIKIISNGKTNNISTIVNQVKRNDALATNDISARGWLMDILNCVNDIKNKEFTLSEVYKYEQQLSALHPQNSNIQPKIRQQLQILRDKGFIEFLGNGKYLKLV